MVISKSYALRYQTSRVTTSLSSSQYKFGYLVISRNLSNPLIKFCCRDYGITIENYDCNTGLVAANLSLYIYYSGGNQFDSKPRYRIL
jgi:hypothetical protein